MRKSPVYSTDILWVKNFGEIALSRIVSEINVFLCFFAKIQDGHQKWQENDFREKSPVDSAHTLWVKNFVKICVFHFWQKFENSKWPPFLKRGIFFENCKEEFAKIPCGSKISTKSLYLAWLRRYKQICFSIFAKI